MNRKQFLALTLAPLLIKRKPPAKRLSDRKLKNFYCVGACGIEEGELRYLHNSITNEAAMVFVPKKDGKILQLRYKGQMLRLGETANHTQHTNQAIPYVALEQSPHS